MFLTKNPERYTKYGVPIADNMWYGTSITKLDDVSRFNSLPAFCNTFVSIEPLLEDIKPEDCNIMFRQVDWFIIGAETGKNKNKVVPQANWINRIVALADAEGKPVFMKDSLIPIVGEENMRRDFPEKLLHQAISPKMKKKLFDVCAGCKEYLKKSDMIAMLARSKRGEQPKQFGFMCKGCFKRFCKDLGLDLPKLAELAENITIKEND